MPGLPDADRELLLLHNPRCSKSRAARALLDEPLSLAELRDLAQRLGRPAREWARRGEDAWRAAGLGEEPGDDAVLAAMAAHPVLIERPIAVRGRRAVVGRPPERVLDLLD